jgi:hypothetical protein
MIIPEAGKKYYIMRKNDAMQLVWLIDVVVGQGFIAKTLDIFGRTEEPSIYISYSEIRVLEPYVNDVKE